MLNFGLHWSCSCFTSEAMIVGLGTKNILEVKAVLLPLSEMFNRFPDGLNLTKTNHSLIPSLEWCSNINNQTLSWESNNLQYFHSHLSFLFIEQIKCMSIKQLILKMSLRKKERFCFIIHFILMSYTCYHSNYSYWKIYQWNLYKISI